MFQNIQKEAFFLESVFAEVRVLDCRAVALEMRDS